MDFQEGVHKSLGESELPGAAPASEDVSLHKRHMDVRWFRVLAAVLALCILGSSILVFQALRHPPRNPAVSAHSHWCSVPVAGLDMNVGEPLLNGIDAASTNDIWMVGSQSGQTLVEHWNGTRLRVISSPNSGEHGNRLMAVTEVAPNNVWAVEGNNGGNVTTVTHQILLVHWDGQHWENVHLPQYYIGAFHVLASIGDKVWAAGTIYTGDQQIPSQLVETTC